MMKKIQMNTSEIMDETFERFIIATKAKGAGDKTLKTYFFSSLPDAMKRLLPSLHPTKPSPSGTRSLPMSP